MLIVDCRNLIGDTIYLIKPLKRFLASKQQNEVALGIGKGLAGDIVRRSFPGIRVEQMEFLEREWPAAERVTLSAQSAWERTRSDNGHISHGYARVLGAELSGSIEPDTDWLPSAGTELEQDYIALAPFSVSCAANRGELPNKTLAEEVWTGVLELIRDYGYPLRVICGPSERFSESMGFTEADYFTASTVEDLVACLQRSRLVVGVDTGICHVSSCGGIPTVVLWSEAANLQFIGETWAPRTRIVPIGLPSKFDLNRAGPLIDEALRALLPSNARPRASEPGAPQPSENSAQFFPPLDSARFFPVRYGPGGLRNWSGHLPFARDLVASLQPGLLVELGTHYGEAYFGFCQAVVETGCKSSCYAVDTWRGDSHSLAYGEEVYQDVARHNAERYGGFSHLLRTTFDDALRWFANGSITLLHIDGLHTYEAAKHDFDAWYPKVAQGGIILLHDTVEHYADFGVWRMWEEVARTHDSFEFHHSHGLGVIRKAGGERRTGGILDYLFAPGNGDAIRRYYVLCADRLHGKQSAAMQPAGSRGPGTGEADPIHRDPEPAVIETLAGRPVPDAVEGEFFTLNVADVDLPKTDWTPVPGKPNTWRALTRDPSVVCPVGFDASTMRFFVTVLACISDEPEPYAQLFWTGGERAGFNERLSVRFPVIADGRPHSYVVDLHAGAGLGDVNHLWWHRGRIDAVRFDPMDAPGEFTISLAGFAHQDRLEAGGAREALGLAPLRNELSSRYLRGSGIEIGALQNPLALRRDAYVRYVDRLTLEQARACFPELDAMALVTPGIICDAAALHPLADRSVDFLIANHVIEHLRDPLGGLREWLRVVRSGGCLYVAAPEHTNPLDRLRKVTDLDHLVADFNDRRNRGHLDREHYQEWVGSTRPHFSDEERACYEAELMAQGYDIHFHTFDWDTFSGMLRVAERNFSAEIVELRRSYGTPSNEFIAILRNR